MPEYSIRYVSPEEDFVLESGFEGPCFIEAESLEGFTSQFEEEGVSVVGAPGVVMDFRDRKVLPMEGSFTLVVRDVSVWPRIRGAFSSHRFGSLEVVGDQRFVLPVRLGASLPSPSVRPVVGSRVEVVLRSDGGVWVAPVVSPDSDVIVTNWGDVPVWGRIMWDGPGGRVVMPSGVGFDLPAVEGQHTVFLDRKRAGEVHGPGGYDRELTRRVDAVSEMVPVGESRTFKTPVGASLAWDVGVFDPWR